MRPLFVWCGATGNAPLGRTKGCRIALDSDRPVKPSKPVFQSVVDLGLRDVGVKSDPRRLAGHFGKQSAPLVAAVVVSVFVMCAIVSQTGAAWIVFAFALTWMAGAVAVALRMVKRSPQVVVKITAEGTNQATWLLISHSLLLAMAALLLQELLLLPIVVLAVVMSLLAWRGRGHVPEALRELRSVLDPDESVLGDGMGTTRGTRSPREAFRLVVATDRRLLVAGSSRSPKPFLRVDAPYRDVSRSGIEWKQWGLVGELSLTVAGVDGAPSDTHVINIAPANLLSIALALRSHGVQADDPEAIAEAERAWEETLRRADAKRRGESKESLFDRESMRTRAFDRGLWLLLGLSAVLFYVDPLKSIGSSEETAILLLPLVAVLCVVCGYVSGTRAALAYILPLNLLVVPTFSGSRACCWQCW
jgi:hypothetical protein